MNIYDYEIPSDGELFETLYRNSQTAIVRIVSSETPEEKLYIQEEDEWVCLLEGEALLEIDGKKLEMKRGDALLIPALTPHRVLKTAEGTLWLAVHCQSDSSKTMKTENRQNRKRKNETSRPSQ